MTGVSVIQVTWQGCGWTGFRQYIQYVVLSKCTPNSFGFIFEPRYHRTIAGPSLAVCLRGSVCVFVFCFMFGSSHSFPTDKMKWEQVSGLCSLVVTRDNWLTPCCLVWTVAGSRHCLDTWRTYVDCMPRPVLFQLDEDLLQLYQWRFVLFRIYITRSGNNIPHGVHMCVWETERAYATLHYVEIWSYVLITLDRTFYRFISMDRLVKRKRGMWLKVNHQVPQSWQLLIMKHRRVKHVMWNPVLLSQSALSSVSLESLNLTGIQLILSTISLEKLPNHFSEGE